MGGPQLSPLKITTLEFGQSLFKSEKMAKPGAPLQIVTHAQRVCRLYKKAMRTTNDYFFERHLVRYEQVLLRQRFEETRKEKDMRKLAAMLEEAEIEHRKMKSFDPFIFRDDEGGIIYHREPHIRDLMVDHWHPWEKANYIDYFTKREELKKEMVDYWKESLSKKFQGDKTPNTPWPIISAEVANLKSN